MERRTRSRVSINNRLSTPVRHSSSEATDLLLAATAFRACEPCKNNCAFDQHLLPACMYAVLVHARELLHDAPVPSGRVWKVCASVTNTFAPRSSVTHCAKLRPCPPITPLQNCSRYFPACVRRVPVSGLNGQWASASVRFVPVLCECQFSTVSIHCQLTQ